MNSVTYLQHKNDNLELIRYASVSYSYPEHNHSQMYTIGILRSGEISLRINGENANQELSIPFIIPPYVCHSIDTTSSYDMVVLCINKHFLTTMKFKDECKQFIHHAQENGYLTRTESNNLQKASCSLTESTPCIREQASIAEPLFLLEQCPEEKHTIEYLAKTANLSNYYFIRQFKERVGLTPHQFQIQNRVRAAQKRINQDFPLTSVALDTGFYDQSHLIREFYKLMNLTPSDYKKRIVTLDN